MTPAAQLGRARQLAMKFHGAWRPGGIPYWTHLEAVADRVPNHLKPVAWLCNILATKATVADLAAAGIHQCVIDAVVAITKPADQSHYDFVRRMENPMSVAVLIAALQHDPVAGAKVLENYPRALEFLVAKQKSLN